ncbi:hypothetical protein BDQ12DRAFT_716702 [Crucibulum laeve]|uniref:Uncharacterized protein n=1 Tax=Crucibulum laeve TaxID=68775 RepID=A0A5C3LGF6_9AGAR|nr:hypothetical protein BDQ12DRAFT_716702 [Crucibulum laeve]
MPRLCSVISTTPLALLHVPLQLSWRVMYKQRWELVMKWNGRAMGGLLGGGQYSPALPSSMLAIRHGVDGIGGVSGNGQGRRKLGSWMGWLVLEGGRGRKREERWEPESMKITGHNDSVYCLEFDTKRIITCSHSRSIELWSMHTGAFLATFWVAHRGGMLCLKFEKDWKRLGRCPGD